MRRARPVRAVGLRRRLPGTGYHPWVDPLLGNCSPEELRQRRSFKWATYPPDVLPAFVAEMDFTLAEPITRAVTSALALGDSGYSHMGDLGEAFAQFASIRFGWAPVPSVGWTHCSVTARWKNCGSAGV